MDKMEILWAVGNGITTILNLILESWFFYGFAKPFLSVRKDTQDTLYNKKFTSFFRNSKTYCVGISYYVVMLIIYFLPVEIRYARLYGVLAILCVMCALDPKRVKQKIFLATVMYLFRWLIYGAAMVLRNLLFALFITAPIIQTRPMVQLMAYLITEMIYYGSAWIVLYMAIKLIHKVYVSKQEDISARELLLLLATLLTVLTGYFSIQFFVDIYVKDTGNYVWNLYPQYHVLLAVYQLVSFAAILIAIVIYQRIKEKQKEEKTNVILAQKRKEANEKGINFTCEFYYPTDANVNAFDVSVILNNAIANAFTAAEDCQNPYVAIASYQMKNAYMIEVKNCSCHMAELDEETALPKTTKQDKSNHGFGLANIRKVAQKYYGDIHIEQDENQFVLTIMLML